MKVHLRGRTVFVLDSSDEEEEQGTPTTGAVQVLLQ